MGYTCFLHPLDLINFFPDPNACHRLIKHQTSHSLQYRRLQLTKLSVVNSVSYQSRATFTELQGGVYIIYSSQKSYRSFDSIKYGGYTTQARKGRVEVFVFHVVECCICLNMHFLQSLLEFKIFIIKSKIFAYDIFGLKCCLHLYMSYMFKLPKTSSPQ